jgi:hypothetical protein
MRLIPINFDDFYLRAGDNLTTGVGDVAVKLCDGNLLRPHGHTGETKREKDSSRKTGRAEFQI